MAQANRRKLRSAVLRCTATEIAGVFQRLSATVNVESEFCVERVVEGKVVQEARD
jgi:hypothetical protein